MSMQTYRLQTPSLNADSPFSSFLPSKSKELTSVPTMINKVCISL